MFTRSCKISNGTENHVVCVCIVYGAMLESKAKQASKQARNYLKSVYTRCRGESSLSDVCTDREQVYVL